MGSRKGLRGRLGRQPSSFQRNSQMVHLRTCGTKCQQRITRFRQINQELTDEVASLRQFSKSCKDYETMFSRFLVKFAQCKPRVECLKRRLEESYDILCDVEKMVSHFSDEDKLYSYLLANETFKFDDDKSHSPSPKPKNPPVKPTREHQRFEEDLDTIPEDTEDSSNRVSNHAVQSNSNPCLEFDCPEIIVSSFHSTDSSTARRSSEEQGDQTSRLSSRRCSHTKSSCSSQFPECSVQTNSCELTNARLMGSVCLQQKQYDLSQDDMVETIALTKHQSTVSSGIDLSEYCSTSTGVKNMLPSHSLEVVGSSCNVHEAHGGRKNESEVSDPVVDENLPTNTSTPSERTPRKVVTPPRVSLIFNNSPVAKGAKRRRKAMLIDPPEPSGSWNLSQETDDVVERQVTSLQNENSSSTKTTEGGTVSVQSAEGKKMLEVPQGALIKMPDCSTTSSTSETTDESGFHGNDASANRRRVKRRREQQLNETSQTSDDSLSSTRSSRRKRNERHAKT